MTGVDTVGMFGDMPVSSAAAQVHAVVEALLARLDGRACARVLAVSAVTVPQWREAAWELTPGGLRGSAGSAAMLLALPGSLLDDNPASFSCAVFGSGGQVTVLVSGGQCEFQETLPW